MQFSFAELQVPKFCPEKRVRPVAFGLKAFSMSEAFIGVCLLPVCGGCIVAHRWFILSED
jgi:hypothetical protein